MVIEIDITHLSLDKMPIYAAVGVPEVWRYDGQRLTIFKLEGREYRAQKASVALPGLTSQVISQFIQESKSMKRTAWLRSVRELVRKHIRTSNRKKTKK